MAEISSNQINETATDADIQALADSVHAVRPLWHPGALVTKLTSLAASGVEFAQLHRAALAAAHNTHVKTPAGIQFELDRLARAQALPGGGEPCDTCGQTYERCRARPRARWEDGVDDHEYVPVSARAPRRRGRRLSSNEAVQARG